MPAQANKYAILIGINRYHDSLGSLKYAVNDCRRLWEVLTQGEDGYPSDHVLLITDDQPEDRRPTYANIHSWLASWLSQPKEDDTLFVYFSGHGRELGGKCYLVPADATLQTLHVTGIPVGYVQDLLLRCKARQKILVLDACHSGAGKDVGAMSGAMLDQIAAGKGIYTITSCDAGELSYEWDEKKQGVFSYYLAEALSGVCPPDAQGRVTAESLYEWVYDRVRAWAVNNRCSQNPKRFAEGTGALVLFSGTRLVATNLASRSQEEGLGLAGHSESKGRVVSLTNGPIPYEQWLWKKYKGDLEAFVPIWGVLGPIAGVVLGGPLFFAEQSGWAFVLLLISVAIAGLGIWTRRRENLSHYAIEQAENLLMEGDLRGAWSFIVSYPCVGSDAGRFARAAARIAAEAGKVGLYEVVEAARSYSPLNALRRYRA